MCADDLRGVLEELERSEPRLYRAICDDAGRVRRHVNFFVNDLHMSERGGLDATLVSGDVVTILPAVSGGLS
jgi:sulfur-carrier protein